MDFKSLVQSKTLKGILWGIGVVVIALLVFQAGVFVGYRKASFSYRWGESYHRNFGGPAGGFIPEFRGMDFMSAHGTFGRIIKIEPPLFIIESPEGVEKAILTSSDTSILRFREKISVSDLKTDEQAVVIGSPNSEGQIVAKLVRVMPPPPGLPASSSTPSL